MPYGSTGSSAADINTIPGPLVERVEVLTGGVSAVYGSDAVSGVVNFIMRDDFEGMRLDAQYGYYQHNNDTDQGNLRQVIGARRQRTQRNSLCRMTMLTTATARKSWRFSAPLRQTDAETSQPIWAIATMTSYCSAIGIIPHAQPVRLPDPASLAVVQARRLLRRSTTSAGCRRG